MMKPKISKGITPLFTTKDTNFIDVKISTKWLHHRFMCTEDYIINTCKGRCCEGGSKNKTLISLLDDEIGFQLESGVDVVDNKIQPDPKTGKCPHKMESGLCSLHKANKKPFGCVASPFTLSSAGTLIVRHRYSRFNCHREPDDAEGMPAYVVFRAGLDLIFGVLEAERICKLLDEKQENIIAKMPINTYNNIYKLDSIKKDNKGAK